MFFLYNHILKFANFTVQDEPKSLTMFAGTRFTYTHCQIRYYKYNPCINYEHAYTG